MPSFPAPAKLNLFLHVTGRRADGYHDLQTIFQFLDYSDTIDIEATTDGRIVRTRALAEVAEAHDLSVRAATLLQHASGTRLGATIAVTKRIPVGSGLGGGSSDAATTLLALNRLWGLNRTRAELAALGRRLGADVPVFVHGRAAWAEGVGDILTPIEPEPAWYAVLVPPVLVSTADVFGGVELTPYSPAITIRDFQTGRARNDLEPVACRRYPEVERARNWLARYGPVRMSGSGGAMFVTVAGPEPGRDILAGAPAGYSGFVARTLNLHPLYTIDG